MNRRYNAPAVLAVLDATTAIMGIAKVGNAEISDPSNQTSSPAYSDDAE